MTYKEYVRSVKEYRELAMKVYKEKLKKLGWIKSSENRSFKDVLENYEPAPPGMFKSLEKEKK